MVKGRLGKAVKRKVRNSLKSAKRWNKRKLEKAYAQVSGKLVAVTATKKKRRYNRRKKRRY